jgi:hypothetical protein
MWLPPLVRLPGAEVAIAAGEPSVQRWSPPLVRLPGAEVATAVKRPQSSGTQM